jgi:hypothetical protein
VPRLAAIVNGDGTAGLRQPPSYAKPDDTGSDDYGFRLNAGRI